MNELERAKDQVRIWINEYRDSLLYDCFPFDGRRWDCNQYSRDNIIGISTMIIASAGAALPSDFVWRDYDNNLVPMDAVKMIQMGQALFMFTSACYRQSWVHKAAVEALTTVEEVMEYQYVDNNWPSTEPT